MIDQVVVETCEVAQLVGTPYCGFAIQAHAALVSEGLVERDELLVGGGACAIVARLAGGEAIGIMVFDDLVDARSLHIRLVFVVPDFRRRGVCRLMHDELVKAAERRGATRIEARSLVGNAAYGRVAVALGHRATAQIYRLSCC